MVIRRFVAKVRRFQRPLVRAVQRGLLHGSLFFLYYLGFGLTRCVMSLVARRLLFHRSPGPRDRSTWWRDAEGYELDEIGLRRQS